MSDFRQTTNGEDGPLQMSERMRSIYFSWYTTTLTAPSMVREKHTKNLWRKIAVC